MRPRALNTSRSRIASQRRSSRSARRESIDARAENRENRPWRCPAASDQGGTRRTLWTCASDGRRRRVRDDVLVLGTSRRRRTRPVAVSRVPDKIAGRVANSFSAGEMNEVQVFEGLGRRNAVEKSRTSRSPGRRRSVRDPSGKRRSLFRRTYPGAAPILAAARCSRLVEIRRALVYSERTLADLAGPPWGIVWGPLPESCIRHD